MTINAARTASRAVRAGGEREILRSLIDWPALRRLGWDPGRQFFAPACDDPVFGFTECKTVSCDQVSATNRFGLCDRCLGRWRQSPAGTTVEEFCDSEPARPGSSRTRCAWSAGPLATSGPCTIRVCAARAPR